MEISLLSMDERFLDRRGCGDELDADARFRIAELLGGLRGRESMHDELADEGFDDVANH